MFSDVVPGYEVWDCAQRPFKKVIATSSVFHYLEEIVADAQAVIDEYGALYSKANLIVVPRGTGIPMQNMLNEAVRLQKESEHA